MGSTPSHNLNRSISFYVLAGIVIIVLGSLWTICVHNAFDAYYCRNRKHLIPHRFYENAPDETVPHQNDQAQKIWQHHDLTDVGCIRYHEVAIKVVVTSLLTLLMVWGMQSLSNRLDRVYGTAGSAFDRGFMPVPGAVAV